MIALFFLRNARWFSSAGALLATHFSAPMCEKMRITAKAMTWENQKHAQQFGLQIIRPHERTKNLKQFDVKQIKIIKLNLCL
jgi:hypothetical protein